MDKKQKQQIIFGTFDGMTSAISIIVPLLLQHHTDTLFPVIVSLALGDGFTMAFGEYLADPNADMGPAITMGLATVAAVFTPSIPFFLFTDGWAVLFGLALLAFWSVQIGKMRGRQDSVTEVLTAVGLVIVFGVVAVWLMS